MTVSIQTILRSSLPKGDPGTTGFTGSQGELGYTGSIGFTGSQGGTLLDFSVVGSAYRVTGLQGDFPIINLIRGQLYYFDFSNVPSSDPLALRLETGSTAVVPGTEGNDPISGTNGNLVVYRVPLDAPDSIVYQSTADANWVGLINIFNQVGYTGSEGFTGSFGFTGSQGYTGSKGIAGNFGGATFGYNFNTTTNVNSDPGSGKFSVNNNDLANVTSVAINRNDFYTNDIKAYLLTVADSTSSIKGYLKFTSQASPENFTFYAITGSVADNTTYINLTVSYVVGTATPYSDNEDMFLTFSRTGDDGYLGSRGDTGYTGSQGIPGEAAAIGFTGSQGDLGYTGSQGAGFTGSQGDLGFTGSQGYTGSRGSDGTSVQILGTVDTSTNLPGYPDSYSGNIGDGYITADTGDLWTWTGSSWANAGQVRGFTGSQGPAGGYTGSAGENGYTGSRGALQAWERKVSNYTAIDGDRIIADTTNGSFDITLPISPATGTYVQITDGGNFSVNNLTVLRNGSTIESLGEDVIVNLPGVTIEFIYGATTWEVTATTGAKGFTGSAGAGFTGSQGEIGFTGSIGESGFTGSQGGHQFLGSQTPAVLQYNAKIISENITITSDQNAWAAGPVIIADGYVVTIQEGGELVII